MKRHASRRRPPRTRERRDYQPKVPITWTQAKSAAQEKKPQLHAVSWRTRLQDLGSKLFDSPRWISLLLLAVLGVTVYLVGQATEFYIRDIEVAGNVTLSRETVIAASGLDGAHIFWADPAEAARRVVENSSVLTATVAIGWPNLARIEIKERAPVAAWDQAGDRFWVDETGRLMQARQESGPLLVILSQERDKLALGGRIPYEALIGALQLKTLRPNIDTLYYDNRNGLSYHDGRNWDAFGVGTDMNQKLVVYETLVDDLMARNLQPEYISVINKMKPFYRSAGGEAE